MKALLVVDMQNGSFKEEPACHDAAAVKERVATLINAMRPGGLIVFIRHSGSAEGYTPGSKEWEIVQELPQAADDVYIDKYACDSFLGSKLDETLKSREVDEVIVTGFATEFCVNSTVHAASSLGYKVIVASDAHTTIDHSHLSATQIIQHHNFVWSELTLPGQLKIHVLKTEEILTQLVQT